jgi:hypothetical protein
LPKEAFEQAAKQQIVEVFIEMEAIYCILLLCD